MKLLICTQVVSKDHPILGFFHRWLEEFAKHCEEVHVICLYEGIHTLPTNVRVYSLGKEDGENRLKYITRFYSYIWRLRKNYDVVFVHMNQVYAVLGSPLWKLWGKKISLWYMHKSVTPTLHIAKILVDTIFTGSKESFRIQTNKVIITGHGIDTEHFAPQNVFKDIDILTVGRITRSKNLHTLIDLFSHVAQTYPYTLTIVGDTMSEEEKVYEQELRVQVNKLGLSEKVSFTGAVTQANLPALLNRAKVFAHVAENGSLDKSTLEALACEVPVITTAQGATSLPLGDWYVGNVAVFEQKLVEVLQSEVHSKTHMLREHVQQNHSIASLIPKLIQHIRLI